MHEILTLQLGQRSNYLATHFWNTQESYFTYDANEESPVDHDVHFRSGVGADGSETYTPRTIIYDLKGGFGTLRKYNALYVMEEGVEAAAGLWNGNQVVQKQPEIAQNEYQKNLDLGLPTTDLTAESVRYWSDFNRVFYHPRSIVQLNHYELHSQIAPFDTWAAGEELFKDIDHEDDILDRDFRPFAEECDQLKGIQVFTGVDDAWGGFAARYIDTLKDEFGKTNIWLWGTQDDAVHDVRKRTLFSLNKARSIAEIAPQINAYIPLTANRQQLPSYCNLHAGSEWYSTALLASVVESVTLPSRLKEYKSRGIDRWLPDDDQGHSIFEMQALASPEETELSNDPVSEQQDEFLTMDSYEQDELLSKGFDMNLSPITSNKRDSHVFGQTRIYRDLPASGTPLKSSISLGSSNTTRLLNSGTMFQSFDTSLLFPVLDSAPKDLFSFSNGSSHAKHLRLRAGLSSTTRTREYLGSLQALASKAMRVDEREMLVNGLGDLSDNYKHRWDSDDESDDL